MIHVRYCWIALLLLDGSFTTAEPFSLITGAIVALGGGIVYKFKDDIKSYYYGEACERIPELHGLRTDLSNLVYGQHIVQETVFNAVKAHVLNERSAKPLVMSFHGVTGSGKNYVADIIARRLFKNGMKSKFVHHIVATSDYPDATKIDEYRLQLRERISSSANRCPLSLFIFDEADKLPERLLEVIKPYLEYYSSVGGVDYRRTIFVFLSNRGGDAIAQLAVKHHLQGLPREQLSLNDFEKSVMDAVFNQPGGLKMSELIRNHLIDHFVPFLPLDRNHVANCVRFYLERTGHAAFSSNQELITSIVNSLQYFPKENGVFSSSGCKRIAQKTDLEVMKLSRSMPGKDEHFVDDV